MPPPCLWPQEMDTHAKLTEKAAPLPGLLLVPAWRPDVAGLHHRLGSACLTRLHRAVGLPQWEPLSSRSGNHSVCSTGFSRDDLGQGPWLWAKERLTQNPLVSGACAYVRPSACHPCPPGQGLPEQQLFCPVTPEFDLTWNNLAPWGWGETASQFLWSCRDTAPSGAEKGGANFPTIARQNIPDWPTGRSLAGVDAEGLGGMGNL